MYIADLHIHSCYARATSRDCVPEMLDLWARRKGLNVVGTGDFTHAGWRAMLRDALVPAEEGLYRLKDTCRVQESGACGGGAVRFVCTGEISTIYKKAGKVRKVHHVIVMPSLEAAERLSKRLEAVGNLHSDGRPILGLDSHDLLEMTLEACPEALLIPAHIWTPHFSLFGAFSGFDSLEACYGDLSPHIHALETGLSSDPAMNWRLSTLDRYAMVSNSDAHSPGNLAREANLFDTELSFAGMRRALTDQSTNGFVGTLEFFSEEGKYHSDGHRACGVCLTPAQTKEAHGVCPVCGGRITVGVLHRVEALADRPEGYVPSNARRYERLVPLREVVAASMGVTTASKRAQQRYLHLLQTVGPELFILRQASVSDIAHASDERLAEGIHRMREGRLSIQPGYDGVYGKVRLFEG